MLAQKDKSLIEKFNGVLVHIAYAYDRYISMYRQLCRTASFTLRKLHTVMDWYQFLTAREKLASIRHKFRTNISHFVKNTYKVKFHLAYMRISHSDEIHPPPPPPKKKKKKKKNLLHFVFDSNSSQICD